jgi:carboxyl-terminal processing protease
VKARGKEPTVYRSTSEGKFTGFPLAVLVNGQTMGGAELIAAALQDHHRAVVVGQRTLGKASVQTPIALPLPGVGLKLTSGTFERPGGKNLHRFPDSKPSDDWGVRPDADGEFRVSPELGRRLAEWWRRQSLRPGGSNERLPLDDPSADPQRQAAVEAVARLLERRPQARAK